MGTGKIIMMEEITRRVQEKILLYRRKDATAQWGNTLKFYCHFD